MKVRIGTRGSDLALWQAHHVQALLQAEPGVQCEIVVLKTRGDLIDDVPLQSVEGKGFFTAEIERALLRREVDLAVHSHKDLATEGPPELVIAAIPPRAPAAERLVVAPQAWLPDAPFLPLREGARVGTSAPRRQEQLRTLRPDVEVLELRGNVPTRVQRLREGRYDAIVLAAAGVERLQLDLSGLEAVDLPLDLLVPSPAQGALAIQVRGDDAALLELCRRRLHDEPTARAVEAERRLLVEVGGGCNLPLGAHVLVERGAHPRPPTRPGGSPDRPAGDTSSAESFVAFAFLGADHPRPGQRARWLRATAGDPDAAIAAVFERLSSDEPTRCGPLAGLRVALCGSADGPSELSERLATLGASVVHERVIAFEDLDAGPLLRERLAALRSGDLVAVTSRRVAPFLAGLTLPEGVRLAAVGASTARALAEAGHQADPVGSAGARALAEELQLEVGARVLFPCAEDAREDLELALAARGVEVERVALYRTVPSADPALDLRVDARVYLSPSAVRAALAWERAHPDRPARRLALGPTTAEALREAGLDAALPDPTSSLHEALVRHVAELAPAASRNPLPTPS